MTQQKTIFAPASFSLAGTSFSPIARALLDAKMRGLLHGVIIHDDLIAEIDLFCQRNNYKRPEKELHTCCPNCLKAHAFMKAKEIGVSEEGIDIIFSVLKGSLGHEGYYLDGDELIKI